jgi:hypothetical protein
MSTVYCLLLLAASSLCKTSGFETISNENTQYAVRHNVELVSVKVSDAYEIVAILLRAIGDGRSLKSFKDTTILLKTSEVFSLDLIAV